MILVSQSSKIDLVAYAVFTPIKYVLITRVLLNLVFIKPCAAISHVDTGKS